MRNPYKMNNVSTWSPNPTRFYRDLAPNMAPKIMKTRTKFYPFSGEYLVATKTAVVSPINMNILYLEVDNPLICSVPGYTAGEISAVISEEIFEYLDAPVIRVGSLDTPVPFAKNLEEGFQANYILKDKLNYLLNY